MANNNRSTFQQTVNTRFTTNGVGGITGVDNNQTYDDISDSVSHVSTTFTNLGVTPTIWSVAGFDKANAFTTPTANLTIDLQNTIDLGVYTLKVIKNTASDVTITITSPDTATIKNQNNASTITLSGSSSDHYIIKLERKNTVLYVYEVLNDNQIAETNKLKVTASDTTSGFLDGKIVGGDGIDTAVTTPGGDEDLEITLGKHFLSLASTGLYTGAGLSIGATTGTFDIDAGEGLFIDSTTDFDNIEVQAVVISARTNVAITNILTDPVTFISIDKDDNIIQSVTFPSPTERRANIFLGVVVHSDNVTVNTTNNLPVIANNPMAQMYDRWQAEGDFFNISGNIFSSNGTNLNVNKSVGDVFKTSINYDTDKTNPHTKTFAVDNAFTFRYRLRDSTEDSDTTVVDPDNYDASGVKTTVPSNKYTIQRFTIFPSAIIRVQYGQNLYDSLEDAEANAALEPFVIEPNIEANGLLRLHLIVEQGATDLSDTLVAKFVEAARSGVAKETNVGGAIFRTQLLNDASTGLRDGGLLTVNGGDNTKFDVASGNGRVIDNTTDSNNPELKEVRWNGFTAESLPNIATQIITFIAIDENDNLVKQNADFTAQEHRDMVVLGRIGHIDNATVTSVTNLAIPFVDPLLTTVDFAAAVGNINTSGNVFSPNGANLLLDKTVGAQFRLGSNKHLDDKNPHVTTTPILTGLTFIPAHRDGSGGVTVLAPTTTIDPDQFDDGSGTLQAVANNKFTAQRVFHFSSNIVVVAFGQTVYDSLDEAVTGVSSDIFEVPGGVTGSINRAAIVVKKATTDLTSATNVKFIVGSKFGEFTGGGGGGGSASTLQGVYDGSTPNPEILTNATNGAFTLRRGSAADTDNIFEGQNNAGTTTFSIDGNGQITFPNTGSNSGIKFSGASIHEDPSELIIKSGALQINFVATANAFRNGLIGTGWSLAMSGSTATAPSIAPNRGSPTTGMGGISGEVSIINGSIESMNFDASNNVDIPNGQLTTTASTTLAAINVGSFAGDPSSLSDGDYWTNSTTNKLRARENGVSVDVIGGNILKAEITLTQSQIQGLNTTPIEMVAAPSAGEYVKVISASVLYDFNTSAFVTGSKLQLKLNGAVYETVAGFITNSSDTVVPLAEIAGVLNTATALTVSADADSTGGNAASTMKVTIHYTVIT